MVSNGLSRRRKVLKRPLVCKSPKPGLCGDCTPSIDSPQQIAHPGDSVTFNIQLPCDPDPADTTIIITPLGPYVMNPTINVLTVNENLQWVGVAPAVVGEYVQSFNGVNSTKCHYTWSINMQVVP